MRNVLLSVLVLACASIVVAGEAEVGASMPVSEKVKEVLAADREIIAKWQAIAIQQGKNASDWKAVYYKHLYEEEQAKNDASKSDASISTASVEKKGQEESAKSAAQPQQPGVHIENHNTNINTVTQQASASVRPPKPADHPEYVWYLREGYWGPRPAGTHLWSDGVWRNYPEPQQQQQVAAPQPQQVVAPPVVVQQQPMIVAPDPVIFVYRPGYIWHSSQQCWVLPKWSYHSDGYWRGPKNHHGRDRYKVGVGFSFGN